MKLGFASKVLRFSLITGIALLVAGSFLVVNQGTTKAAVEMVTLCHAAGQSGTSTFTTITIAYNAAYGPAGHFNEDGTPNAGHENDYLGACIVTDPTATPTTPVPTNTPTATLTATTPAPTNTPTATLTATTPAPTNTPTTTLTATTPAPTVTATTPAPTETATQVKELGTPVGSSELLIPVTGVDLTGGSTAGKLLLSLGFGFLGLGLVSYGITKKQ